MNNAQIAEVFERIAGLLELKRESVFIIRAYQRAARTIEHLPTELAQMVNEGEDLQKIAGIGVATPVRLVSWSPRGNWSTLRSSKWSSQTAMHTSKEMGISTAEALEQAIVEGRLATLPRHIRSPRTQDQRIPLDSAPLVARRGWCYSVDILNTRPVEESLSVLRREM